MKVLIINGSYHRNGIITALIDSFKSGLLQGHPDAQIHAINLLDLDVTFCTGTSVCGQNDGRSIGECVIKDGMAKILEDMVACDILVFASPIYCLSQTAIMKRFLERCLPLVQFSSMGPKARNSVRKDKKGVIILSTGAPYPLNVLMGFTQHAQKVLSFFCRLCGCAKVVTVKAGGMEKDPKAKARFLKQAADLAGRL
jgi:multimeric flavodoxin WrbA